MRELTVKNYANAEGVHERTVRRWIEKGAVTIRRTPGGGIRVVLDASSRGPGAVVMPSLMASEDNGGQSSN